jgi:dienelactone hydrolase
MVFAPGTIQTGGTVTIRSQTIGYRHADAELTGLVFWDDSRNQRRPGVLVVHGGAGLDNRAKDRASGLAALGFIAFACDMYGNGVAGNRDRVMARITELRDNPTKLCQRAQAGLQVLASHPQAKGPFAAVGYCFGGMTVLELARSGAHLAGAVSIHGSLRTSRPAEPGTVRAKILVCHGALDPHVPMPHVDAFVEEMNRAGADYQLIVYGGAMHGFTHEAGATIPGVAYNALADARSAKAMEGFFVELFGNAAVCELQTKRVD